MSDLVSKIVEEGRVPEGNPTVIERDFYTLVAVFRNVVDHLHNAPRWPDHHRLLPQFIDRFGELVSPLRKFTYASKHFPGDSHLWPLQKKVEYLAGQILKVVDGENWHEIDRVLEQVGEFLTFPR